MKICPVCEARISSNQVLLSSGAVKDCNFLYTRVCRYARKPGCINLGGGYQEGDDYEAFNKAMEQSLDRLLGE